MTMTGEPITEYTTEVQRIRGLEMPWNRGLSTDTAGSVQGLNPWHPQEFLAECVETICETGDMMTFVFRRVDGAPLAFRAGQYLNIDFSVHGSDHEPVSRSYSISSAPTAPWTFSITVKRDPHGLVSPWVHEHVRPGTVLDVLGPVGGFHLPDADRRARYLLLAAGAGITPIMSMIRTIRALPGRTDVIVLYHAADPESFAFGQELGYLAMTDSRMKIYYSLGDRALPHSWAWFSGRLNAAMLDEIAPDANGRQVYACGPEGYLQHAQVLLGQVGVDDSSIHVEYFSDDHQLPQEYRDEIIVANGLAQEPPQTTILTNAYQSSELDRLTVDHEPADAMGTPEPLSGSFDQGALVDGTRVSLEDFETVGTGQFVMSFTRSGKNVRIDPGQNVLDAAQAAGIRLPMNCRQGMCGSCKSNKTHGEVEMHHQGGIRAREIDAGKFLPCCSTPCSDLIIEA